MESYVLNGCAQWEFIMGSKWESILDAAGDIIVCSTGHYWCAQLEIIGVLNGKLLCAQLDIIEVLNGMSMMCSTGHYWGVQREVMCSTGNYNVLNWTLLGCSMGSYVLNWTLLGNLDAQWEVLHGKLMVCILLW